MARNDAFKQLAQDLGLHIAAMKPLYLDPTSVDHAWLEKKEIIKEQLLAEGKKPEFIDKILEEK